MAANLSDVRLGLSPCPNDTFIFHALLHGHVSIPGHENTRVLPYLADVEKLNGMAREGACEITKISLGVVPEIADRYLLLSAGAALGWGCGPLLVAPEPMSAAQMRKASIAIPGRFTTANMLLDLHGAFDGPRHEMLFSGIMDAVVAGKADMGLIIHEGRFTYPDRGLVKLLDMGEWWEQTHGLPLPLGAIAIRRDLPPEFARSVEAAIARSLEHAWRSPEDSRAYIREHAQEMDDEVTSAHIRTFVTAYSRDLGGQGRAAIARLVGEAQKRRGGRTIGRIFLAE